VARASICRSNREAIVKETASAADGEVYDGLDAAGLRNAVHAAAENTSKLATMTGQELIARP
jgi:hypothetical protein